MANTVDIQQTGQALRRPGLPGGGGAECSMRIYMEAETKDRDEERGEGHDEFILSPETQRYLLGGQNVNAKLIKPQSLK